MKRKSVKYYKELLNMRSKNMAYIDPIRDIGTFDSFHMEFKEPIEELIRKRAQTSDFNQGSSPLN